MICSFMNYKNKCLFYRLVKKQTFAQIMPLLILFLIISSSNVSGYTDETGIQDGDVMAIEYEGRYADNNVVFDSSDGETVDFTVSLGSIIRGFYDGLLGLKVGESAVINVPVGKGYSELDAPLPELANRELNFNVFIHGVTKNVNGEEDSSSDLFSTITTWVQVIGSIAIAIFVIIGLNGLRSKSTTAVCAHCKGLGRSTKSEGKCSKCGSFYCRASFGRGCPNCKGNSFIPV